MTNHTNYSETDDFSVLDEQFDGDETVEIQADIQAETHIRCYHYWLKEHQEASERFDTEIARLMARSQTILERMERRQRWHLAALKAYYTQRGRKRLVLANATLTEIKGRERVEVADMDALSAWIKDGGGVLAKRLFRHKTEPNKPEILAYIKETGEIPSGTNLVTGDDALRVKF